MNKTRKCMCVFFFLVAFLTLAQILLVENAMDIAIPRGWFVKSHGPPPPTKGARHRHRSIPGQGARDAWAVRRQCKRPKPVDTVFLIHSSPAGWKNRAVLRLTLLSPWARNVFNWAGIFLLGRTQGHTPDEELTDAWTRLEANALGDLVRLPFKDDNPAGVSKFLAGLRWVRRRCPSARYVVKMDDSMMVEPTMFRSYLNTRVGSRRRVLHCRIKEPAKLTRRDGEPSVNPSEEHFPRTFYFRYCYGQVVVMNRPTAKALLRTSQLVPAYPFDDAYMTGDVALSARVSHQELGFYDLVSDSTRPYTVFERGFMLARLETPFELTTLRWGGWYLSLWNDTLHSGLWSDSDTVVSDSPLQQAVSALFRNRSGILDVGDALGYRDEAAKFVFERVPHYLLRQNLFFFA